MTASHGGESARASPYWVPAGTLLMAAAAAMPAFLLPEGAGLPAWGKTVIIAAAVAGLGCAAVLTLIMAVMIEDASPRTEKVLQRRKGVACIRCPICGWPHALLRGCDRRVMLDCISCGFYSEIRRPG